MHVLHSVGTGTQLLTTAEKEKGEHAPANRAHELFRNTSIAVASPSVP